MDKGALGFRPVTLYSPLSLRVTALFNRCLGTIIVTTIKIIVEKHFDGYVAYPLGIQGAVVGEGNSYDEALTEVKSALIFHLKTFGADVLKPHCTVLEAYVAEANV
jgi:predicted RNase H-like HicB family nuclease